MCVELHVCSEHVRGGKCACVRTCVCGHQNVCYYVCHFDSRGGESVTPERVHHANVVFVRVTVLVLVECIIHSAFLS